MHDEKNVGEIERVVSTAASLLVGAYGATRRGLWKMPWLVAASALAKRGVTGKCDLYSALNISTLDETESEKKASAPPRLKKSSLAS